MNDTKTRILDAAERLFAVHGFEAASLRAITAEAQVNLAAVNYHFQTKECLTEAVIARRLGPINQKRLRMLDVCEAGAGKHPPAVAKIMEAFYAPVFELPAEERACFMPLMGRMFMAPEEFVNQIFERHLAPLSRRFDAALARALPALTTAERKWRLNFAIGAMSHTLLLSRVLPALSGGVCDPADGKELTRRMVAFAVAGLSAPATDTAGRRLKSRGAVN